MLQNECGLYPLRVKLSAPSYYFNKFLERHDETSKDCTASNEKDGVPVDVFSIGEPNGLVQQLISLCRQNYAS